MNFPEKLLYTKDHEWTLLEGDIAVVGITDFAQSELGDIVFVETPEVGTKLNIGDSFGVVESVKTVSDLYSPLTGEVVEVNEALVDAPETVNTSPYGDGWIVKIKMSNTSETESLMSVADYKSLVKK
ncbi:Glycine cleavage system H protein [hydrothermal vent metagenome]|uniref:Glycine cleavage system H protein n=1 Tax=hydrothermal vent metagenome TaxID=652676 RepID=A0A3B1C818_9ZZZZ